MKRLGGEWTMNNHHQVDGDKWVCLDHILARERCLIYSFGIRDDWSFEDQMDLLGGKENIIMQLIASIKLITSHSFPECGFEGLK